MERKLLNEAEIRSRLKSLKEWNHEGKELRKTVVLKDFVHSMGFVNSVALLAEKINHHPDIDIRWNKVSLVLSTHSAGGLTEYDFTLAGMIDEL